MARTCCRPHPTQEQTLTPALTVCPACHRPMRLDYHNGRTVTTLDGVTRLTLHIRRCHHAPCARYLRPYRPEIEGRLALPHHEFGLDIIALVGTLRHAQHRSVPEIHQELSRRGSVLAQRTVSNLLDRYDELRALASCDAARLRPLLQEQGHLILALDGLQPDVGHEVLWVVRDCLSGEPLLAKSLLSATQKDLAALLTEVVEALGLPVTAVISDGQHSIRKAVAQALPGVPHQLCHFHYLREAARPLHEADRHAKKELKKTVRGIRKVERQGEGRGDALAEVAQGHCAAVRSALTDDGRPPLAAPGLRLEERLTAVCSSLERTAEKRGRRAN